MERINLPLLANQKLSETPMFKDGTPSNSIIFKKLCGIGATHGEANIYKRHSIIIVPNTPVLKGKQKDCDSDGNKKYPNIFTVYEGVTKEALSKYLQGDVEFKKILCTPEAYVSKVKKVFDEQNDFDLFNDFFMLLDECDKIIKDADFRYALVAPIDDFFQFKNKAMISATAIVPSDRRFEDQAFKRLYVRPVFKYKQKISLIGTNNIIAALKDEFSKNPSDNHFIFVNSVDLIQAIIELLQIENDSKVFCAEKSKTKIIDSEFKNVSTDLGGYSKYNFLTCRFFNAVDINLEEQPRVILVTDIWRKSHSMLDPYSDSVQIVGRFRNKIKSVVHISNFNHELKWKENERAMKYLKDSNDTYNDMKQLMDASEKEGSIATLNQAMQSTFIHSYIKENGELDPYLVDGYLFDQRVTSFYPHMNRLHAAYINSNYFRPLKENRYYNVNDQQIISIKLTTIRSRLIENIAQILNAKDAQEDSEIIQFDLGRSNEIFKQLYPDICEYYASLGFSKMEELEFEERKILKEVKEKTKADLLFKKELVEDVQKLYKAGDTPAEIEITANLNLLYVKHGNPTHARSNHITNYYNAKRTTNSQRIKVWKIEGLKQL